MTELKNQPPTHLTNRALGRLKELAEGNGLTSADIVLIKGDENVFELEATTALQPHVEVETQHYPGHARTKDATILGSFAELHSKADHLREELKDNPNSWLEGAIGELKSLPGEGFGYDDAKITLPEKSVKLFATENCTTCLGQKTVPCPTCQAQGYLICEPCRGTGKELCYQCSGRGEDPQKPGTPCFVCQGTRYAHCRWCIRLNHPPGRVPCTQCSANRRISCEACKGFGTFTEEATLHCSADTKFHLLSSGFPSGFNRALDRIGITKIDKIYADIETFSPTEEEQEKMREKKRAGSMAPSVFYRAKIPYADLRLNIKGTVSNVSVFGKRCLIMGVPKFLDNALIPARQKLAAAIKGHIKLKDVMDTRIVSDALKLQATRHGTVKELRRLYPFGLSEEVAQEITVNARLALNKETRMTRTVAALLVIGFSGVFFYSLSMTSIRMNLLHGQSRQQSLLFDCFVPILACLLGWFIMTLATRYAMMKTLKGIKLALAPSPGKTGIAMFIGIFILYGAFLYRLKPSWLLAFLS